MFKKIKSGVRILVLLMSSVVIFSLARWVQAGNPQYYTAPSWQSGQWVEYTVSENNVIPSTYEAYHIVDNRKSESSTIKVSIVGTQSVEDKTYYWYEFKQTKPGYWNTPTAGGGEYQWDKYPVWVAQPRTIVAKMLVDGPEFKDIRVYQIKIDGETPKEYTDGYLAALPEEIKNLLGKRPFKANLMLMEGTTPGYDNLITGEVWGAQRFKAKGEKINAVSMDFKRVSGQNYDLVIEIYDDNNSHPGTSLAKQTIPYSEISTSGGLVDAVFTWSVATQPDIYYHVVAHTATSAPGSNLVYYVKLTDLNGSTYADGTGQTGLNQGTSWTDQAAGRDFKLAVMYEMPQIVEEDVQHDAVSGIRDNIIGGDGWAAQQFKVKKANNIYGVALDLKRLENYDLVVEIRSDNGGLPGSLLRSKVVPYQMVDTGGKFIRVDFGEPLAIAQGEIYHLVAHTLNNQGTLGGSYHWKLTDADTSKYADGEEETSSNGGSTWSNMPNGRDFAFVILESDPSESGWSLIKPTEHQSDVAIIDRWGSYDNVIGGNSWTAQEIKPNKGNITGVTLDVKRIENYNLKVEVYNDNNGLPGSSIANKVVPYSQIGQQGGIVTVYFNSPVSVTVGNRYHVVLHTENDQGANGGSYRLRLGHLNYSVYPYGEQETGISGSFYNNHPDGRDYYLITHYLNPEGQETLMGYNTDRVVSNRWAVKSWFSNTIPVTGIVKRITTEGIGIQREDDSIEIKQDELLSDIRDNAVGGTGKTAQQVKPTAGQISGVSFDLKRNENYDLVVELTDDSGGLPSSNILASKTIPYSQVSTTGAIIDIYFDNPVAITPGGIYHFVLRTSGAQGGQGAVYHVRLTDGTTSTYPDGEQEVWNGGAWVDGNGRDLLFRLHYDRNDRFHNSYQTVTLSNYGQTGAVSDISNPTKLSLKSQVPNGDNNTVNSPVILGGYRQDNNSDTYKQEWFNAGANYTPVIDNYDESSLERSFADGKPYYYAIGKNWQFDLYDKWRSGLKGICWQDEPYARQHDQADTWNFKDATSEKDAANKYRVGTKYYLGNKYKYWDGSIVPSYDGTPHSISYSLESGADVAMIEEWLSGPASDMLDGITLTSTDIMKINNAGLRGVARNHNKMWGRGAYPGVINNNLATTVLESAFDEGADYLLYWADNATTFNAAKTSVSEVRGYVNVRRQQEYLPDTVLLLPKNLGYWGNSVRYSWGIGTDASVTIKWEEYHWKDILQDFYAKAKELLNAGTPFDIAFDDDSFKSYLYKTVYLFNGTEGNWWDTNWTWRVPVSIGKNASQLNTGTIVRIPIDFHGKLIEYGISNPDLDENSIRVVSYNRSNNTFTLIASSKTQFDDANYNGSADLTGNGRGDVKFKLESSLAADTSKVYYVYFDITGTKPAWGTTLGAPTSTKYNNVRLQRQ